MQVPGNTITIPANTSLTTKHMETFDTKSANGNFEVDGSLTLTIEPYITSGPSDIVKYTADDTNGSAKVRIEDANTPPGISIIAFSKRGNRRGDRAI